MRRISLLLAFILCVLAVAPGSAEIINEDIVEFPTFSCSVAPGSYLIRGTDEQGYLFICYPEYKNGNTNITISASRDTLTNFNPVTMDSAMREVFGMSLLSQTTEQLKSYGYTVSDAVYSWGDLLEVDGQTGIILKNSMQLSANGINTKSYSCGYMTCVGDYRYNFSAGAESEERSETLLRGFLDTLHWKTPDDKTSVGETSDNPEEKVLGKAVFLTIMDGKATPAEMLENDQAGVLAALFFLDLEKNQEVKKGLFFQLDTLSDKAIYTGVDQKNRAFSAFPEFMTDEYLVVALDGGNVVNLGMFPENDLNAFLEKSKVNKTIDYYFFIGSYQGLCSAIGLDPAPYDK